LLSFKSLLIFEFIVSSTASPGITPTPTTTNTSANANWEFQSFDNQPASTPAVEDKNDPWAKAKHLIDLDLSSNKNTSAAAASKQPMGAMSGAPMVSVLCY
jgi:hypothetical protein